MAEPTVAASRKVKTIRRYLPTIYSNQVVVDFECGCWVGSRSSTFGYDCPVHAAEKAASDAQQSDRSQAGETRD